MPDEKKGLYDEKKGLYDVLLRVVDRLPENTVLVVALLIIAVFLYYVYVTNQKTAKITIKGNAVGAMAGDRIKAEGDGATVFSVGRGGGKKSAAQAAKALSDFTGEAEVSDDASLFVGGNIANVKGKDAAYYSGSQDDIEKLIKAKEALRKDKDKKDD